MFNKSFKVSFSETDKREETISIEGTNNRSLYDLYKSGKVIITLNNEGENK